MDFEVRHIDGTTVKLISSEHKCAITSATQTRKLCGNDTVTINLQSATYIDFYVGDKITIFGTTYTLNQLPTVKKEHERSYTYTLVFEGLQYTLIDRVFLMPANTQGDNLMFDLAGMLDVLDDNINRGNSGKQYEFVLDESLEETEYKNLSLTGKNCLQVLQQLCQEWDTEFVFAEEPTRIAIYIGVAGSTFPTTFKYGRGGGVYELNREKGASDICTRLFVYGGTQNLTYYRHNRLCLPSKEKNQSFVEDATAQAVYGIKEQVKNFDDIYPNRIGTITSLSGCDYNEFIDSAMADEEFGFDLNEKWANNADDCAEWLALKGLENTEANRTIYYNDVAGTATKYLMAGATAKIHFNTGALAGYECDLHSYTHSSQKFVLKPLVDENGYDFPSKTNAAFKLAVGDEYVILDINLPTAYKTQAESKLATEAASYFDTVCRPQPKYTLTIEPIALKHIVGPSTADTEIFKVGDLINVSDPTGGVESATIRIDQFVRNLLDPFDYKLTLTDEITYSQQVRTLIEVDAIKRVVEESKIYDVNRIRRGWKDAEELYNQMFDTEGHYYSEKIAPLSIDTQMLKVGARSQQLVLQNVLFQPNYNANPANLQISAGSLVHYTIAEPDIKTWTMSALSASNVPSTAQYVYAKCAKNGTTGTWLVTDQAIIFDSDPSYYHFLVGSLSSVDSVSNTRNFAATYGFTTINGRNITTGVIKSSDGSSVVIDLDAGEIIGKIKFRTSQGTDVNAETYIGETAEAAAKTAVDNLEIGGKNLLIVKDAKVGTANSIVSTKLTEGWFHLAGTFSYGTYPETRPAFGNFTEADTPAKDGIYTLSIQCDNLTLDDNFRVVVGSYALGSTSGRQDVFLAQSNGSITIDLTGRWLLRVLMHGNPNANGKVINGNIRFKLEKGNKATDWTPATEDVNAAIEAEATALETLATTIAGEINDLQQQIDGQIMSFFYNYVPTMQNEPAATWHTQGTENVHLGDLFYDTSTGYAYRFANTGTEAQPVYSWLRITDTDVTKALADAAKAQATADKKMRTFTAQPVPPYDKGDVWLQGELGDILYCGTAKTEGQSYAAADWVTASKYIDQTTAETVAKNAVDALEIGGRNYILAPTTSGTNPTAQSATYTYDNGDYVITKASGSGFSQLRVKNAILKYSELGNKTVTISVKDIVSSNANNEWRIYLYATKSGETDYGKRLFQTTNKETFTFPTFGDGWNCGILLRVTQSGGSVGDTLTVKGLKLEKGSKSTDWTPAPEDTEAEIAIERARLDNIDSDTVFSIAEKEAYRTDFEKIVGLGIPVAGYIPTAAELAAGSYNHGGTTNDCSKGTFCQHYSLINTTAINTLGALSTAYTNLRDFLVEVGLYVNTDYGTPQTPFSRTALAELICAYQDAESDVAFYAENVSALEGECNLGTTATSKRINCYQVPKATMLQDMLADVDMKMRVTFKYGNTVATPTFSFRNDGGMTPTAFVPTGCSSYELNFYYNGATSNTKCYWLDGMVFELKYRSATSTAVTLECVDESSLKAGLMIASSLKGTTTIEGGLVLTRSILMQDNEDNVTAGITGLKEGGVAVFAGGTLAEALAGLASVIINRDGLAKFGKVYIDGRSAISQLYMVDALGKTRFLLRSGSLKSHPAVKVYNSDNSGDDGTRESTSAALVANATTAHQTYNLFALANMTGSGTNPQNYNYSFQINIQLKVTITSNGNSYYGFTYVDIQYYDGNGWNSAASYSIRNDFADTLEETVNVNVPYSNNVTPAQRGLRVVYWKDNAQSSHNTEIEVDTVSWCYFGELSDRLMQIAANGLEYFYDTNNLFKVQYSGGKLTTSIFGDVNIKGNTDIAGVLWAGRITAAGDVPGTPSFRNINVTLSKNGTSPSSTSLYNFTYTGISGTPTIMATPEPTTNTDTGWTAQVISLNTSAKTFSVRIKRDNTSEAAAFHLVIFGTT